MRLAFHERHQDHRQQAQSSKKASARMHIEHAPTEATASREQHRSARVPGRWLLLARVGWVAVAGLALALFIASPPASFALSDTVCHTAGCTSDQLTPAAVQHLYALCLSLDFFAWYILVLKCLFVLVFAAVGLVIFWRKAADRTALVAAFTFLTFPITFNLPSPSAMCLARCLPPGGCLLRS
jgi:hypothetical protein